MAAIAGGLLKQIPSGARRSASASSTKMAGRRFTGVI
jgi:hypothetical protein